MLRRADGTRSREELLPPALLFNRLGARLATGCLDGDGRLTQLQPGWWMSVVL